jgi:stage IV sporulation protein FB
VRSGYLTVGWWRGAPLRVHWTLPLGAVVFGGGKFQPGVLLGFTLLVLVHEVGHALLVRRYRSRVVSIDVHALGGACRWSGDATAIERAKIAWGGVDAQLVLFFATVGLLSCFGEPESKLLAQIARTFTTINGYMMALNLLPVAPFDGAEAWKLPRLLAARRRRRVAARIDPVVPQVTQEAVDELLQKIARDPWSGKH